MKNNENKNNPVISVEFVREDKSDTRVYYFDGVKKYSHEKREVWLGSRFFHFTYTWREFDVRGNEIHKRGSNGEESWHEYDEDGVETYRNILGEGERGVPSGIGRDEHGRVIVEKESFTPFIFDHEK